MNVCFIQNVLHVNSEEWMGGGGENSNFCAEGGACRASLRPADVAHAATTLPLQLTYDQVAVPLILCVVRMNGPGWAVHVTFLCKIASLQ